MTATDPPLTGKSVRTLASGASWERFPLRSTVDQIWRASAAAAAATAAVVAAAAAATWKLHVSECWASQAARAVDITVFRSEETEGWTAEESSTFQSTSQTTCGSTIGIKLITVCKAAVDGRNKADGNVQINRWLMMPSQSIGGQSRQHWPKLSQVEPISRKAAGRKLSQFRWMVHFRPTNGFFSASTTDFCADERAVPMSSMPPIQKDLLWNRTHWIPSVIALLEGHQHATYFYEVFDVIILKEVPITHFSISCPHV